MNILKEIFKYNWCWHCINCGRAYADWQVTSNMIRANIDSCVSCGERLVYREEIENET